MNFFCHAVVARLRRPDLAHHEAFVLGAVLPDLASMVGARLDSLGDPLVSAGIDEHHRADARFHACEAFVSLYVRGAERLRAGGVARGSARAASHVGIEMLLDGCTHDEASAASFRRALVWGAARPQALACSDQDGQRRLLSLLHRLTEDDVPAVYADPDGVSARLVRVLARRPRLALDQPAFRAVALWLQDARDLVAARASSLIAAAATP